MLGSSQGKSAETGDFSADKFPQWNQEFLRASTYAQLTMVVSCDGLQLSRVEG